MIIIYESKTGFTKRYAELLSKATGFRVFPTSELEKANPSEEVIFLGWMKVGKIVGLSKVRKLNLKAVCGSGTGREAEPSEQAVIAKNKIDGISFFYLRGGCKPLKELKGMDRLLLSLFVMMLKKRRQDEKAVEAASIIENGYNGVRKDNLAPVLEWLKERRKVNAK